MNGVAAGLLDTCVVVELGRGIDLDKPPRKAFIAAQTLGELSVGPIAVGDDPEELARRTATLQVAEVMFRDAILPYDAAAARTFASVVADTLTKGRSPRRRVVDLQIAAIAVTHSLPLYTINVADFQGIQRLEVMLVDPSRPAAEPDATESDAQDD